MRWRVKHSQPHMCIITGRQFLLDFRIQKAKQRDYVSGINSESQAVPALLRSKGYAIEGVGQEGEEV